MKTWSINGLSDETGMDRRTLKRLFSGTNPAETDANGDRFTLRQLVAALRAREDEAAGDLEREQARLTAANADLKEMERAVRRRELLEMDKVKEVLDGYSAAVLRVIKLSGLPPKSIDEIVAEIRAAVLEITKGTQ